MSPQTSPFSSPKSRSRSISRPPRIPEHIPPLPRSDSSHLYSDFRNAEDSHIRSRADSGLDSDVDSDMEQASGSGGSSLTLNMSPLEALKSRLQPLRHVEDLLVAKLVLPNEDEATHLAGLSNSIYPPGQPQQHSASNSFRSQEVFVRPGAAWKGALSKARVTNPSMSDEGTSAHQNGRPNSAGTAGLETTDEPQEVLHSCQRDLISLWNDEVVREILRRKKVRLEEFPGL
jgi:hypothetical protein